MKTRCVAVLCFATALGGRSSAQGVDAETVDQLTARALKHLTTNCRFAYKAGAYGDIEFGKNFGYTKVEGYFGETTGVARTTEVRTDRKTEDKFGDWVNGDQTICTKEGDQGGTVIFRHHVPWAKESDAEQFAIFYGRMGLPWFFLPSAADKYGRSRNPDCPPYRETRSNPPVTTITEDTHLGRPCIKVEIIPPQAGNNPFKTIITEYYLDREHGMVLAKRQKGMLHIPKESRSAILLDVEQLTEVTYGPPTENGLPFPTAVKGWFVWPTGRREPMTDVEFSEFRRYTPTADELDFEKQFGIPLPALPPKPKVLAEARRSRALPCAAGGLGLTAVALIVVCVRRRPGHERPSQPT